MSDARYRARSLWLDGLTPGALMPRPALEGEHTCDVAIVGAGFVGLWTAYSLARADPTIRIAVVEAEVAGFGAAGRNAGFVSAGVGGNAPVCERRGGAEGLLRAERAMIAAVDEIGSVVADEGIECGWSKAGSLRVATSPAQLERVRAGVAAKHARGLGEEDARLLDGDEVRQHVRVVGALGGSFTPHCARVDPARLVRGLASACERRGVTIYERSPAVGLAAGTVTCAAGTVRAPVVLRATEAFTIRLPAQRRRFSPVFTRMLATEPLPAEVWEELGWAEPVTVADHRYLFHYGQRTTDGRIALGGSGAGYGFGSSLNERDEHHPAIHARIEATLRRWFPALRETRVTHRWGGALATPRDWGLGICFDRRSGLGWAGGLAGHGLVASSICGRTLADLVLGRETELTTLPWVGHESRRWEPEPLRFVATRSIAAILDSADRIEDAGGTSPRRLRLVRRFTPQR